MLNLSRQKILLGEEKQKKISDSNITIVGVGALGTVATELLTRSGVYRDKVYSTEKILEGVK